MRNVEPLWRLKASDEGRLHKKKAENKSGTMRLSRQEALIAWGRIADALGSSDLLEDRQLALEIRDFI